VACFTWKLGWGFLVYLKTNGGATAGGACDTIVKVA
jgi:hypothetical protein